MALLTPVALAEHHPIRTFDCGKPALNDWLIRHARQASGSGSSRTFVATDDGHVAGFFSLTVGHIDPSDAPERFRKGMGNYPIPVVILTRLAVDLKHQSRGVGIGMLQDAIRRSLLISDQAGIRALLTHPKDPQAERFYRRFGFESSPLGPGQLLLLLKDARKFIGGF